jgi:hypothetical protein
MPPFGYCDALGALHLVGPGYIRHATAIDPSIFLEERTMAISHDATNGCIEEGCRRRVLRQRQGGPWLGGVIPMQPQPAQAKSMAHQLEIRNPLIIELQQELHSAPCNRALSTIDHLCSSPQECLENFLERLQQPRRQFMTHGGVNWNSGESGLDQCKAATLVHQFTFPRRKLVGHLVHQG